MWILHVYDAKGESLARVPFKDGEITIGRNANCTVVLTHPSLGPVHGRLEACDEVRLLYTDEGSPAGSRVQGVRVEGAVFLEHGKAIDVPGHRLEVERVQRHRPQAVSSAAASPPRPASAALVPAPDADPVTQELHRQIRSIQSHREEVQKSLESRREQLDRGWIEVLSSARKLQETLSGNPRVQHFVISRDGREVAVKLSAPAEKLGYRFFILAREHPDGKYPTLDAVWLREFGRDDASFTEPKKAMTELVQRIAGTLA